MDPHQANLQPGLLLLGSRLRFNPTPTFLGVTFDRTHSFSKHVTSLKAKFFPCLKALRCICASSWGPSKESLSVLYKSFLRSLLTCQLLSLRALRPLFPFRQAQYVPVFPLKPAPFCTLFAGLGNTIKSAIFLPFSSCLTLALSSPPCSLHHLSCYLKLCGRSGRNCLFFSSCSIRLQWVPGHSFLRGNDTADELARRGALLAPSAIPCSLLPLVSTLVLSRTGGILSLRSILTHRFPQFPLRNLCSLVMLAVSSLVFAAMDTAFF